MFKNLIQKYLQLSKNTQIIIAFLINGVIIEILKIILLIQLGDPVAAVTYGTTISYISAYIIQYKIYKIGNFFSKIFIKYIGFTIIAILFIRILVNYLLNLPSVQKYLAEEESESKKKMTEYCLMIAPVILISIIQLFLNTKYIFVISEKDDQYALIFFIIAFIIYYLDSQNLFIPPQSNIEETKTKSTTIRNNSNNSNNTNNTNNSNNNIVLNSIDDNKNNENNENKKIVTNINNSLNSISIDTSKVGM